MEPQPSDVLVNPDFSEWVRAEAEKIDLPSEVPLVEELSSIMEIMMVENDWIGVSSNNIYWERTPHPLRVIRVPIISPNKEYCKTLVNPHIISSSPTFHWASEECGSVGSSSLSRIFPCFLTKRHRTLIIEAYVLEDYLLGLKKPRQLKIENPLCAVIAQHEIDHLNGTVISDIGVYVALRTNSEQFVDKEVASLVTSYFNQKDMDMITVGKNGAKVYPSEYLCLDYHEFCAIHGAPPDPAHHDTPFHFIFPYNQEIGDAITEKVGYELPVHTTREPEIENLTMF